MLDLKEEQCSVSEDQSEEVIKRCTDCQTTTTPLWRGGPAGPKVIAVDPSKLSVSHPNTSNSMDQDSLTLCNACGIKYHKRRRALLGLHKGKVDKSKKNIGMPFKIKIMASGIRQRENNLEVEQAAMLLMALSYGSVYA